MRLPAWLVPLVPKVITVAFVLAVSAVATATSPSPKRRRPGLCVRLVSGGDREPGVDASPTLEPKAGLTYSRWNSPGWVPGAGEADKWAAC